MHHLNLKYEMLGRVKQINPNSELSHLLLDNQHVVSCTHWYTQIQIHVSKQILLSKRHTNVNKKNKFEPNTISS